MDVISFDLSASALFATVDQATIELPFDRPVIGVVCKPRADAGGETHPAPRTSAPNLRLDDPMAAFVDLFHSFDTAPARLRVTALTDFTGLKTGTGLSASANVIKLSSELETRFRNGRFDHRLVNMRVRQPLKNTAPPPDASRRKGFSYASYGLSELLRSLSPGLEDASQSEVSSRLAFLTSRPR